MINVESVTDTVGVIDTSVPRYRSCTPGQRTIRVTLLVDPESLGALHSAARVWEWGQADLIPEPSHGPCLADDVTDAEECGRPDGQCRPPRCHGCPAEEPW